MKRGTADACLAGFHLCKVDAVAAAVVVVAAVVDDDDGYALKKKKLREIKRVRMLAASFLKGPPIIILFLQQNSR